MMSKITSALRSGVFWAGFVTGTVFTLGFSRLIRRPIKDVVAKMPGAKA